MARISNRSLASAGMRFISEPLFLILHWMYEHIVANWGMGDPAAHAGHQPGHASDTHHHDEVGAEDAAHSAADGGDQGALQEVQDDRSGAARR